MGGYLFNLPCPRGLRNWRGLLLAAWPAVPAALLPSMNSRGRPPPRATPVRGCAAGFAQFVKLADKAAGWAFLGLCEFETGDYTLASTRHYRSRDWAFSSRRCTGISLWCAAASATLHRSPAPGRQEFIAAVLPKYTVS